MPDRLRAAILVISDTAYITPTSDRTIPILTDVFDEEDDRQWDVVQRDIVPDNISTITNAISSWSDGEPLINLIITSGGTGFAVKDQTPEAVGPLIDRHAPGLVHAMLAASLQVTPFPPQYVSVAFKLRICKATQANDLELVAMMSRPVAGVRNRTLIITLPGSPKGAKENLQAILKLLPHACQQAAGADSRSLHAGGVKKMEQEAGVGRVPFIGLRHHPSHDHSRPTAHVSHGHGVPQAHTFPADRPVSNDPQAGPTRRYRESPYPMLSVDEVTKLVIQHSPPAKIIKVPVTPSIVGQVLAESVRASENVPAFRASTVDGYAIVLSTDSKATRGIFPVASVSHATPGEVKPLAVGQIARITTGAPLPPGATSVVMVEDTYLRSMTDDGKEEREVEVLTDAIRPDENVREVGSDIAVGQVVLEKGDKITGVGGELGLLASIGQKEVLVYRKPTVGVLSTGDEIIQHDRPGPLRIGEVRDCNRLTVMAAVQNWGYEVKDLGIANDTSGALESTLRNALRSVDVIITTGGVSMGELDLLKPTIERSLGGTIHFGRVAMKPGKPTTFATIPFKNNNGDPETRLIFGLPGNPASAIVTLHLFVLPSLNYTSGKGAQGLPKVTVVLDESITCRDRRAEYHRAIVKAEGNGELHARSTGGQRSSRVGSLKAANALLCMPAGGGMFKKGQKVDALLMGQIGSNYA